MKTLLILVCLVSKLFAKEGHDKNLRAVGVAHIPIVIVLDVVEKRLPHGNEPLMQIQPNTVSAKWSMKPEIHEPNPEKIRMLERRFGKPVLFDATQTATVWVQTRWVLGSGVKSYAPIKGNLILSRDGREFFNKPVKELIEDPTKVKLNHGAMLVIIKISLDELLGKAQEKKAKPQKQPAKKNAPSGDGKLLPTVK